ncbi:MAG TPA: alkaline phosphatase family protein [bacterium]|nr:alkaline phosphatase family protein [bacterium]HMW35417.1 alkaline phosphatase family protein [bacterium]HMY36869.1 alkaline phosphatase family protein [bacterium]HMZ03835.1 alkaline phosphatase family protein [bacterium]HNB09415.1 alkaline phosphatase family protein [bacterium]
MKNRRNISYLALIGITIFLYGCSSKSQRTTPPKPPRLIVFIALDQFRYDYLTRFSTHFGANGFNYLLNGGASFANCLYEQATTHTSVGHATMMSGTLPYRHGIIANYWWSRELHRYIYAPEDTLAPILGIEKQKATDGRSPRNFSGINFADALREKTNGRAKVFSVSNKDRSAVLMGGKNPNGAYWMVKNRGGFYTSAYYMNDYPVWVKEYNAQKPADKYFGMSWEMLLDKEKYPTMKPEILRLLDLPSSGFGHSFPHPLKGLTSDRPDTMYYKELIHTPFASEMVLDFAKAIVQNEALGSDEITDILCISLSANDEIGHSFGPSSPEVMDITVQTDRLLARFFKYINTAVKEEDVLYVLTSDHGVPFFPEEMADRGVTAARVHPRKLAAVADSIMALKYGKLPLGKQYVDRIAYPDLYFDGRVLAEKKIDKEEASDYISAVFEQSLPIIYRAYSGTRLKRGLVPSDPISEAVRKSFHSRLSGDVVIVLKPFHVWDSNGLGTEHSLPYAYDAQVPLIFKGKRWIKSGLYKDEVAPTDIVPVLSVITGCEDPGGRDGQVPDQLLKFSK